VQVKDGLCAGVLDFVLPIVSQIVKAQAVRIVIDQITQALAYSDPARIVKKSDLAVGASPHKFGEPSAPYDDDLA